VLVRVLLAVAVAWAALGASVARSEPRVALVIGNSAYDARLGPLANPTRDADQMAAALQDAGFQVEVLKDLDQGAMKRAISRFGARLASAGPTATGLFFYAGHGLQSRGVNYMAPVGAAIDTEADIELEAVSADVVLRQAKPNSELSRWFCAAMAEPFEFEKAVAAFPLDKLSPPEETRETKESLGSVSTSVESVAVGETWEVEYRYQFKEDNVSEPFGFTLTASPREFGMGRDDEPGLKWLKEFGKPVKSLLGWEVKAGPEMYPGGPQPFSFSIWSNSDRRNAEWFYPDDVKHARELCR